MAVAKAKAEEVVEVATFTKAGIHIRILGDTPMILNRMSEKAQRVLLLPSGTKTAAERQSTLKHNPYEEFRASPYRLSPDPRLIDAPEPPTLIAQVASAFKGAMGTAALDLPGAKKTQIGRLVYVKGDYIPIYGEPQLLMSVTRSADIAKTPDIRSRVIVPHWACEIDIEYVTPILREKDVINLITAAGITAGVGDWRPEKGKGSYGQFSIANADDADWNDIVKTWGRKPQLAAMDNPVCYNEESAELLSWWGTEVERRGFKGVVGAIEGEAAG